LTPSAREVDIFSEAISTNDIDLIAQWPEGTRCNFPEMRRRRAAAGYVERECAKGDDRKQVIRKAVKIFGPFSLKSFAEWLRKGRHREPQLAPNLEPPPPFED
jgi:hypothetical protein